MSQPQTITSAHTFTKTIVEQAHEMDRADAKPTNPDELGDYARWYATNQLHIFPLKPGTKIPATSHAYKDATTDLDQINTWWARNPHYNIGLACGPINGFDVWDIDGPTGYHSWLTDPGLDFGTTTTADNIVQHNGFLGMALTPRGAHIYVQCIQEDRRCDTDVFPGVDLRGSGGYVVAPPSIGPNNQPYMWINPLNLESLR